eukprot:PLAT5883.1.p1 GENE.PLAT5883.1~~PLAT5883.1.p1  ORF type:complete len:393 (+),score=145.99 PLAT5883.1:166-1179(+)
MTGRYPDLVEPLRSAAKEGVVNAVIDSEIVAFDRETGKLMPFQELSHRGRKDVMLGDIKTQVVVCAFDLLYLNDESYLEKPLKERRAALHEHFNELPGKFQFATYLDPEDMEDIEPFLLSAVDADCEGLMVKTLEENATYHPSKRSLTWLKLKKDYMDGVTDTVDVVPLGAWKGKGKRTGVYGAYLLGVYDAEEEQFQSLCRIGTGFSDEQLQSCYDDLQEAIIAAPPPTYLIGSERPDVWFKPAAVWEVKAADLSISPRHQAAIGLVDASKGISLRFPRLIRVRDDKGPEDATSAAQIACMYRDQFGGSGGGGGDGAAKRASGASLLLDDEDESLL